MLPSLKQVIRHKTDPLVKYQDEILITRALEYMDEADSWDDLGVTQRALYLRSWADRMVTL